MSRLEDGTNPYGRLLDVMRGAAPKARGLVVGEYLGEGKFLVGDQKLSKGDYLLLQHTIMIDGEAFSIPELSDHEYTIHRDIDVESEGECEGEDRIEIDVAAPAGTLTEWESEREITIDGELFALPSPSRKEHTIVRDIKVYGTAKVKGAGRTDISVVVPSIQKGDKVLAYQLGDEDYVILGRVV